MIPSYFPKHPNGIALIGDMPRAENSTSPFSESFYGSVASTCRQAGFDVKDCFHGNLLNFYPPDGKYSLASAEQAELSKSQLLSELTAYNPRAVIFLGDRASRHFKPDFSDVESERGAPFFWNGIPAVVTHHPREVFVQFHLSTLAICDYSKAFRYSKEGWTPPPLNLIYRPDFRTVCEWLNKFIEQRPFLSCDIETDAHLMMTCIGFAFNPTSAITIPLSGEGRRYWTEQEEKVLWPKLAQVLETCKLIGHNAIHFDHKVLAINHGILPNFVTDTMFAHWECYSELLKSLGFCSSLYTDFPYWKEVLKAARQGKIEYWREYEYNGRDCCVCLEVAYKIRKELDERPPAVRKHLEFNIRVAQAFQYMSIRGVDLDKDKLQNRLVTLNNEVESLQLQLWSEAGRQLNVRSPKQVKTWLYDDLKLPVQYKTNKTEDGDYEDKESSDNLSLLYLARSFPDMPALLTAASLRKLLKRISSLSKYRARPNGRISWDFNLVGTETGRASGYKPLDGCGVQPQNVDSKDRDLFLAGDGLLWLKADLEGADSWTVAAQCAALGDYQMLEDLQAGIKPAQALAIANLFGEYLISAPASELIKFKKQLKEKTVEEEKLRGPKRSTYDVMKAVSHGSNYGMQKTTMHQNIFKKSNGDLWITPDACQVFQNLYLHRYRGIRKLHEQMVRIMNGDGFLDSFAGTRRFFFGRNDNNKIRSMLSHVPQANTSYATNKLIERAFYWSENRYPQLPLHLILEMVNQVHDETCFVFREERLETVRKLFPVMSDFEMECWGVKFKIPFEAAFGDNWGECKNEL